MNNKFKISAIFSALILCLFLTTTEGMRILPLEEEVSMISRNFEPETGLINRPEMPILTRETRGSKSNPWPRGVPVFAYPDRYKAPIAGP